MLQNLCNNLYSEFIEVEDEDLEKIRNKITIEVEAYVLDFAKCVKYITSIEANII